MTKLPRAAQWLWLVVVGTALVALFLSSLRAAGDPQPLLVAALFALAGGIAGTFQVQMPASRFGNAVFAGVGSALYVAAVLVLPPHWAIVSVAVAYTGTQISSGLARSAWFKSVFNIGQMVLCASAAEIVWELSRGSNALTSLAAVPGILLVVGTFFAVNSVLVSAIIATVSNISLRATWWRIHANILPSTFGQLFVGVLIAVLWTVSPWAIALAIVPLTALYYALQHAAVLETQTLEALFQLADILDDRDSYTHGHSLRVGHYAERLAFALHCSGDQAYQIFLAGRLHDIGKCAIRNEVLLKPGALDDEEREHMCKHAEIGESMLSHFALFKDCGSLVGGHHERWDGMGYPRQLKGEDIPFGARVIAVADSYDAMTTTRPYRTALGHDEALRRLRAGAGTQWDARIVYVFIEMVGDARQSALGTPALPNAAGAAEAAA